MVCSIVPNCRHHARNPWLVGRGTLLHSLAGQLSPTPIDQLLSGSQGPTEPAHQPPIQTLPKRLFAGQRASRPCTRPLPPEPLPDTSRFRHPSHVTFLTPSRNIESTTKWQNAGAFASMQDTVGPDEEIISIDSLTTCSPDRTCRQSPDRGINPITSLLAIGGGMGQPEREPSHRGASRDRECGSADVTPA